MMASHTPGPWTTSPVGRVVANCGNGPRATVWADEPELFTQEVIRANARLISAAPEMFEALKELLSGHDNLYVAHFGPNADPTRDIATHAARAALAKASGGQP